VGEEVGEEVGVAVGGAEEVVVAGVDEVPKRKFEV
jgi:hypothetical protein